MATESASNSDVFITLLSAAREDAEFAKKLLAITRLSEVQRKAKVRQLVDECRHQGAPGEFIAALSYLGEESVARKVSEYLKQ